MKSENRLVLSLLFFTLLPCFSTAISMAFLPYPFNTWHANARTFAKEQEEIRSYQLTIKIKRRTKTIKEQSFTAFNYQPLVSKALKYVQKEQIPGLKTVFKPSIRVKNWDVYALGNIVHKALPADPAAQMLYWEEVEKTLIDSFYVTPAKQKITFLTPIKKVLALGFIPFTLMICLSIFLVGLILLHYVTRRRI
jgi:hypothetical protein